jgi:hypothetical protein
MLVLGAALTDDGTGHPITVVRSKWPGAKALGSEVQSRMAPARIEKSPLGEANDCGRAPQPRQGTS